MSVVVYAGVEDYGEAYELVLSSEDVDLTSATGAVLHVRAPDKRVSTWPVTVTVVGAKLKLLHIFSSALKIGAWSVFAEVSTPSGKFRSEPRIVFVKDPFDVR